MGSTFEEDDLSSLKAAFENCNQKSLSSSPLMQDIQPVPCSIDDYMSCSDGSNMDGNHNLMASMMLPLSGHSHFDDLSSSIINSQNLSPFGNNFLNGLCSSPQTDMLIDAAANNLLRTSVTSRCDSTLNLLYLNGDKNGITSIAADSSSGSVCTSIAASSTDVEDALLRSIEEADCFFDSTPSPTVLETPITSCSMLGNLSSNTPGCVSITSPVLSSPEDGVMLSSHMNEHFSHKNDTKPLKKLPDLPPPPKKPLSPYMRFSKGIWQKVKAANPGMTVCEVGANIGRVWRELSDTDKQRFNDEFLNDKIRYDTELQKYLQVTGLQASDLIKPRTRKKDQKEKPSLRKTSRQNSTSGKVEVSLQQSLQQDMNNVADLTHQTSTESLTPVGLPSFSQVWSQSDFIPNQDVLGAEMSLQGQNVYEGTSIVTDNNTEQLLNGISLQNSLLGQGSLVGDLQQHNSLMQPLTNSMSTSTINNNNNIWSWQQFTSVGNDQEQMTQTSQSSIASSLKGQQHLQQFKKLSNLSLKSINDNETKNFEGLRLNGIHSDIMQTGVDAEKLLLRSALVEKSQEVLRLMKELEQAYGLIHQLKQQNDFFHQHWNSLHQHNTSLQVQHTNNSVHQLVSNTLQQLPIINNTTSSPHQTQQIEVSPKSKETPF